MFRYVSALLCTCCFCAPAFAADAPAADASAWKNNIELGAVQTSGNTHTLTINAKARTVYESDLWRITINGNAINSSANHITTAEKYDASLQGDRKITKRDYLFTRLSFESDRFAGFRKRTSETVGYGRQLIKTDSFEWKAEIGGGLRQSRRTDHTSTSETVARASTDTAWHFSEASKLTEELNTEGGAEEWTSKSVTALQTALNSHLSSKISLSLTHHSQVPLNTKKLDIETAITLVVNF